MSLIDLTDALDADNCEPFTLLRYAGNFVAGGYTERPTALPRFGVISAPSGEELDQIPEGDRVRGAITVHTWEELKETNAGGTSDTLQWQGENYKIVRVWPYPNRGYWHALAVRMSGL